MTDSQSGGTAENEATHQSERLATIGHLAAGVAHEINNPVAYVHSNLESLDHYLRDVFAVVRAYEELEQQLPSDHPQRQAVAALRERVDLDYLTEDVFELVGDCREGMGLVIEIVTALKDFSKQATQGFTQTDINDLVDRALRLAHSELKYRADVERRLGDLPLIRCRAGRINQVLVNLLVNAAHAIEHPGRVTVTTSHAGDCVRIEIADTGPGIPAEQLETIFAPFYTTKASGKGTGLGLSVAREIVNEHEGRIWAESEPGDGARFIIEMPADGPSNK